MHPVLVTERKLQRRSAVRYMLQLPVIFYWIDAGEHTAAGFTCDVALDGALIQSAACPPIGCDVRIEVLIPSLDISREQVRIQCLGKVTRAVRHRGGSTFGVRGFFDDDHITRQIVM
jgi:hypothetical protein